MSIFKLPDLGEGLPEAEISEWLIKEGDSVILDQAIVTVETAKALIEIPSPQSGIVSKFFGIEGDIIHTGDPLLEYAETITNGNSVPKSESKASTKVDKGSVVGEMPVSNSVLTEKAHAINGIGNSSIGLKATPAVRALARRCDVELSVITPTGPDRTITSKDVERVSKILSEVGKLQPLKGVRRTMAVTMSNAHAEVVAVTLNEDADISAWDNKQDTTIRLIRAITAACKIEPALNAWYDSHSIGRRIIKQVHIGIAVDTSDGLFVPVIRDVAQYSHTQLRDKINELKIGLKKRNISPDELRGQTITLSNFGGIGGRYANPIVVPPTVAILGAGTTRDEVCAIDGEAKIHKRIPLSLTFDHRAVTGGEACRFIVSVIKDLQLED
ncbi:Dihydrolipoamide acyltransferase component of branched-chain alpha-keto acid dehydrogenase complex [hydrothermal vent metagenome]|uniref:Dihydrolipoamide acyltransferase component of branched-chain alpha-keto acid dehydrogenase complex n=1 Tax=hydrothermal vent metagenome TaxID=652676 RepID=A0A3B1AEU4_9ZZZZ